MKKIKSNWHKQPLQTKFLLLEAKKSTRLSWSVFITGLIKPNSFNCSPWVSTSLVRILDSKCQTFFIPELQFLILWLTFESSAMGPKLFHLGARLTVKLLLEFILLRRNKNIIKFSIAEKLFFVAPTPIFKQYFKFHLCKCAPVRNHWSTYKDWKSFCL